MFRLTFQPPSVRNGGHRPFVGTAMAGRYTTLCGAESIAMPNQRPERAVIEPFLDSQRALKYQHKSQYIYIKYHKVLAVGIYDYEMHFIFNHSYVYVYNHRTDHLRKCD